MMQKKPKLLKTLVIFGLIFITLTVLFAVAQTFFSYWLASQVTQMNGISMEPTYASGEGLFVRELRGDIERGVIVVYRNRGVDPDMGQLFIKRVAGIPTDSVMVENGQLFVNRELFDFPGQGRVLPGSFLAEGVIVEVPANQYFLIGDNPNWSQDSRNFGWVNREDIVKQIIGTYQMDE